MARAGENWNKDASLNEREIASNIVRLINNCFEEGQYESGLTILAQSCSASFYPPPAHLRQVLYIALYPPTSAGPTLNPTTPRTSSPRKLSKRNRVITPQASREATNLLVWLASVNSPSRLLKGLPACGKTYRDGHWEVKAQSTDRPGRMTTQTEADDPPDEDDSPLCKQAHILVTAKDVWDEERTEQSGKARYSPLLLLQIPPSSPRFNVERPLEILLASLLANPVVAPRINSANRTPPRNRRSETVSYEVLTRKASVGVRLLKLIVNLTLPADPQALEPAALIRLLNASISSAMSHSTSADEDEDRFTLESFDSLFQNLDPTKLLTTFKIGLLCLYLASNSTAGEPTKFLGGVANNQGQYNRSTSTRRAMPPRRLPGIQVDRQSTSNHSNEQGNRNPFPLPEPEELVRLLELQPKRDDSRETRTIKGREPVASESAIYCLRLLCNASAKVHLLSCIMTVLTWNTNDSWREDIRSRNLKEALIKGIGFSKRKTFDDDAGDNKVLKELHEAALNLASVIKMMDA
ncbi:hypothetical protein FRC03_005020 [Tulasnella sp. 419]|nr:hypothetical protein FRC03_005020 [Tulasnella sp. 419]